MFFCLKGGLGHLFILGIQILFRWEREDSVRPAEKVSFEVVVYPKELMQYGI